MVASTLCSCIQVANILVNLLVAFGSFKICKQLYKKVLTWSLDSSLWPKSCKTYACDVRCNSSWNCSSCSFFSVHHSLVCLKDSSIDICIAWCIFLCTQAPSNYLCVMCCNYSRVRASSSDLCIVYCTYLHIWDSSNNLCVTLSTSSWIWASSSDLWVLHYSFARALSSSNALYALRTKYLCWQTSNLRGG
jgi:hypothetical protein